MDVEVAAPIRGEGDHPRLAGRDGVRAHGAVDHDQGGDEHGRDDPEGSTHARGIGIGGLEPNRRP
jgi:hypothetical protein